jgi:hypothetical protein
LATLRARGPYPLLAISGEQGSAKTVLSKMLKALIDASAAPVRALPREERELMIAANNGYLLAFDNSPACPPGSRMRCVGWRAAGVSRVRQLYTEGDEVDRLAAFTYGNMAASPLCKTFPSSTAQNVLSTSSPARLRQMEALKRYRIGGEQKVTVQHACTIVSVAPCGTYPQVGAPSSVKAAIPACT